MRRGRPSRGGWRARGGPAGRPREAARGSRAGPPRCSPAAPVAAAMRARIPRRRASGSRRPARISPASHDSARNSTGASRRSILPHRRCGQRAAIFAFPAKAITVAPYGVLEGDRVQSPAASRQTSACTLFKILWGKAFPPLDMGFFLDMLGWCVVACLTKRSWVLDTH